MKEFLLVRHAKSSWSDPGMEDRFRPLNKRGKTDGPFMAKYCRGLGLKLSHLISSPAVRAHSTATFFLDEYEASNVPLHKETDLYFCSQSEWMDLINELDDSEIIFPAFFSHNPTITYFANAFGGKQIENVPTCGVIHLKSTMDKWSKVDYSNTQVMGIHFPKAIRNEKEYF